MTRTEYRIRQYRYILDKAGLKLHKSRIRDKSNDLYGTYTITKKDSGKNVLINGMAYAEDLDEIEEYIKLEVEPMLLDRKRYK